MGETDENLAVARIGRATSEGQICEKGKISSVLVVVGKQYFQARSSLGPCIVFVGKALYSDRISPSPTPVGLHGYWQIERGINLTNVNG